MNTNKQDLTPSRAESWKMFNTISEHYDLLNRLLSFGIDKHWRRRIAKYLRLEQNMNVLDLATGTADVLLALAKEWPELKNGIGLDMAENMLAIAKTKIEKAGLSQKLTVKKGDANDIIFSENTFENVTIAFGIRNVADPLVVLKEMRRVLIPSGKAFVLEFSLPKNALIRGVHLFYLRHAVPFIGGLVSGQREAYRYLNRTIEEFPHGEDFLMLMKRAGFARVGAHPLLFGVATIYVGEK
jgi:demethylmenaquinone methyltransferase/2-methoxy-6-polyprenyl-1,4-benzoquinol methylase